jgi:hypothetical protein
MLSQPNALRHDLDGRQGLQQMTDITDTDLRRLDIREKLAHIDQMLADHDRSRAHIDQLAADHDRKRQEMRLAPWQIAFAGMTAGAALFASGAAVGGLLTRAFFS